MPEFGFDVRGIGQRIRDFLTVEIAILLTKPLNRTSRAPSEVLIPRASAAYDASDWPRRSTSNPEMLRASVMHALFPQFRYDSIEQ
jgi:hypothetical protein